MKSLLLLMACVAMPVLAHADETPAAATMAAIKAHRDGNLDEALRIVQNQFEQIGNGAKDAHRDYFITMFEWGRLAEEHASAQEALISERDKQERRLLDGDAIFSGEGFKAISRLHVIIEMNRILQDNRSTHRLVTHLLSENPSLVRGEIHMALPAILEAGDYALVVQHIKDPLARLGVLNQLARELPLFPQSRKAPRLAAELSIFMGDVNLLSKALKGLGKEAEATALNAAAIKGIASDELRGLAIRELDAPGSIIKAVSEHEMNMASEIAIKLEP